MSSRSNRRGWLPGAASVAMLLMASAAFGQPAASSAAANTVRDPHATAVVERMAKTLVAAQALRVEGDIAWDVVQADGQTLEFGATRELVLRRPDRLRADVVLREGGERRLFYDGKQVVLHDPGHGVYAAVDRSGPVGEVAAFVGERLGIPIALAELLSPDLAALLSEKIGAARYVASETIDGVACDHIALRGAVGGMQLWVGTKDSLPRRIAITYEHEEGRPQFRAHFTDWDLSPRIADSTFVFDPPEGVEKIAFAVPRAVPPKETPR